MGDTPRQEQLDLSTDGRPSESPAEVSSEPVQAGLFPDNSVPDELVGYRGPSACQIAGPVVKAGKAGARDRADDLAREVAALAITLHTSLIKSAVRDVMDR